MRERVELMAVDAPASLRNRATCSFWSLAVSVASQNPRCTISKADRLSDAQVFKLGDGLPWANRLIPAAELKFWRGERAQAGRMPEKGWPRAKRFKE